MSKHHRQKTDLENTGPIPSVIYDDTRNTLTSKDK